MKPINSKVKITSATDDTFADEFIGMEGIVTDHNTNNETGNTAEDPLHVVEFPNGKKESFWDEELTLLL